MRSFKELRTDPHRPSVMDPAEYVFVGAADDHPGDSYLEIRHDVLARGGVETGSSDRYSATGVPFYDARPDGRPNYRCHHCGKHGSNIRYFCFFLHMPSQQVIVVGQICAKKLSLGSRDELDFQKRADEFRRMQARHQWVANHQDEFDFLRQYDERHKADGFFSEFLASLWDQVQSRGHLTDRQLEALRRWMTRGDNVDADRHQGHVTRREDTPTEAQVDFIKKLADDLDIVVDIPETRIDASNLINGLKAKLIEKRAAPASERATERQISFINSLMDERQIPLEDRRKARQMLDAGLSKSQASRWIERLQELPRIEL